MRSALRLCRPLRRGHTGIRPRLRPRPAKVYSVGMTRPTRRRKHRRTGATCASIRCVRLRWLAVIGQTTAVLVVYFGLDFELPIWACLAVIALCGLAQRRAARALSDDAAARARPRGMAAGLRHRRAGGAAVPHRRAGEPVRVPVPRAGAALGDRAAAAHDVDARRLRHRLRDGARLRALSAAVGHRRPARTARDLRAGRLALDPARDRLHRRLHAWQITEEARQLADALAATELVLAREQHLSQLDGLAAAAAHELGTPLCDHHGDRQGARARDRAGLRRMPTTCGCCASRRSAAATSWPSSPSCSTRRAVRPHAAVGADRGGGGAAPQFRHRHRRRAAGRRDGADRSARAIPAILYGLGNLLENAVDFARERVEVAADWSDEDVAVTISDDGPGFAPEIMDRIGEPYVTSRRQAPPHERRQRDDAAWASASSSPRPCWNAPARRSISRTAPFRTAARWCGCAGAAAISNGRRARFLSRSAT